jgi:hypothetical protein
MIQILLHGLKMDPLVLLYYFAPVCALINITCLPFTEGLEPFYDLARIGPLILISNACLAFVLNVTSVFLVGVGSGLVVALAGVTKVRVQALAFVKSLPKYIPGYPSHYRVRCNFRISDHAFSNIR